jgi:hypothetical protein
LLIWLIILLLFLLHTLVKGTFHYTRIKRWRIILIPTYTLFMVIISVDRHPTAEKFRFLAIIFIVGMLIGKYQASGVQIIDTGKRRLGRPVIMAKRNWPYLIGWIIIFSADIALQLYFGLHMNSDSITDEFVEYIIKNLNPVLMVFFHTDWYIWTLTASSYLGYYYNLVARLPKVHQIWQRKHSPNDHY